MPRLLNDLRIHCITNYVTANDCANLLLAAGAIPVMADAPEEAAEITEQSKALVLNLGTLNPTRLEAMLLAGKTANAHKIPVVLDPVGVYASSFRREAAKTLLRELHITAIRGNLKEIRALLALYDQTKCPDTFLQELFFPKMLANRLGAYVISTGEEDIVTDGKTIYIVENGDRLMRQITGAGCMLSALLGGFLGQHNEFRSCVEACIAMGYAGELAAGRMTEQDGTASFRTYLIDAVSHMSNVQMGNGRKVHILENPCLVDPQQLRLYAVTDRRWLHGQTLAEAVEAAIQGGVTFVQLREKDLGEEAFLEEAITIKAVCAKYGVPLIINDNVDVALRSGADGVHLGQKDGNVMEARERLGNDKIIGVSAATVGEALLAELAGANYIGCGAVFSTGTKTDTRPVSRELLSEISASVRIPVVAIGGITLENAPQLKGTGIAGTAVVSALFAQEDIRAAAEAFTALEVWT